MSPKGEIRKIPMNKRLTTISKNVKDTGLFAEPMGTGDVRMNRRYSCPLPERERRALEVLESSRSNFHNTTNNEEAARVVSIGNH
ncbi:MAG: hypothetical protein QG555_1166 [Thermodesulfobacteriota bacterium]|nr:hypothetical protein [Thermodesulfobacteriota bacterium]